MGEEALPLKTNLWDELDYFESFNTIDPFVEASSAVHVKPEDTITVAPSKPSSSKACTESATGGKQQNKRKAAVAAASRATRAKKKEELESLKRKHEELLEQRKGYLETIQRLQVQVQANREAGSIDLRMENELLRAELGEHKRFISQFKSVADGAPTTTTAKKEMCINGADTAISQVLGLLNTSTIDTSWRRGFSKLHPELSVYYQRVPNGCSRTEATRINFRVDAPVVPASAEVFRDVQTKAWCDADLSQRLSSHFGQCTTEIKEIDTGLEDMEFDDNRRIKVYYYRERRPKNVKGKTDEDGVDTVFVVASKKENLPFNALPSSVGQKLQGTVTPNSYPTTVIASTSTSHSKEIEPKHQGVHRINSVMLEGVVIREVTGGIAVTWICSYPLNQAGATQDSNFLSATGSNGWIKENGYFTSNAEEAIHDLFTIYAENIPEAAQAYIASQQG